MYLTWFVECKHLRKERVIFRYSVPDNKGKISQTLTPYLLNSSKGFLYTEYYLS